MTVAELMEELEKYPKDAIVYVNDGWGLTDPAEQGGIYHDVEENRIYL